MFLGFQCIQDNGYPNPLISALVIVYSPNSNLRCKYDKKDAFQLISINRSGFRYHINYKWKQDMICKIEKTNKKQHVFDST